MSRLRLHDLTLAGQRVVLRPMIERGWLLIVAISNDPEIAYSAEVCLRSIRGDTLIF